MDWDEEVYSSPSFGCCCPIPFESSRPVLAGGARVGVKVAAASAETFPDRNCGPSSFLLLFNLAAWWLHPVGGPCRCAAGLLCFLRRPCRLGLGYLSHPHRRCVRTHEIKTYADAAASKLQVLVVGCSKENRRNQPRVLTEGWRRMIFGRFRAVDRAFDRSPIHVPTNREIARP